MSLVTFSHTSTLNEHSPPGTRAEHTHHTPHVMRADRAGGHCLRARPCILTATSGKKQSHRLAGPPAETDGRTEDAHTSPHTHSYTSAAQFTNATRLTTDHYQAVSARSHRGPVRQNATTHWSSPPSLPKTSAPGTHHHYPDEYSWRS